MQIKNVRHKGLRRFVEHDDPSGLPTAAIEKIRNIVSFLQDMANADELKDIPVWKAHQLRGERAGTWSLHVTKNWRITFLIDKAEHQIVDLDFEDYH
jgi:proteic killer suppression protein